MVKTTMPMSRVLIAIMRREEHKVVALLIPVSSSGNIAFSRLGEFVLVAWPTTKHKWPAQKKEISSPRGRKIVHDRNLKKPL